jgi:outer membrane protein assembly factor BamB
MHRGGPQLQGVAQAAAPEKAELLWTFTAGKAVKGAAAIADGKVYFGDDAGIVHAVDLASGKKLWSFKTEGAIEATPLVLGGVVFIGSSDAHLYALDAATGELQMEIRDGRQDLGGANFAKNRQARQLDPRRELRSQISIASMPRLARRVDPPHRNYITELPRFCARGILFGGCDSFIHVLQLADGKELRQIDAEAYIASSVAVFDGLAYVGNYGTSSSRLIQRLARRSGNIASGTSPISPPPLSPPST